MSSLFVEQIEDKHVRNTPRVIIITSLSTTYNQLKTAAEHIQLCVYCCLEGDEEYFKNGKRIVNIGGNFFPPV